MPKCMFVGTCTHVSGWCSGTYVNEKCEYFNENLNVKREKRKREFMEETKKRYYCGYCQSEYDTPAERAKCELECDKKRAAEEERQLKEKLAKEKQNRLDEITAKRKELSDLEQKYYKDYGVFAYTPYTFQEPYMKTVTFDGNWGKFFEDCFA